MICADPSWSVVSCQLAEAGMLTTHNRQPLFRFAQTGSCAAAGAQEVQLGAADARGAQDFDLVDDLGMNGENTLHAMTKADLADGEAGLGAAAAGDDDAFKRLQAFLVT